jgi:hypothetical protein
MPQTRDGGEVKDVRLGRLIQFDERSKAFPIRSLLTAEQQRKPRSYTWRLDTHLDQGEHGSCVGFGWAHELLARPMVARGIDYTYAFERIYWEAQKIDDYPGGEYPGADPQEGGSSVLAGAKIVQAAGHMKEYRWAFSLDELILALSYAGPVVLGINWLDGMFQPDENSVIHATGDIAGGHCILASGVNLKSKLIRLEQSWGVSWGIDGHCYISFDDMDTLLNEQGEACIPVGRHRVIV